MLTFKILPLLMLFAPEGSSRWSRLLYYLDYPGFEAWKFFNLAIFAGALTFILVKKARLGEAFRQRREGIKDELERARQERDQALAKLKEVEERLAGLDSQIAEIKQRSQNEAVEERQRIARATEDEIAKLTAQAQREIENAGKSAKTELRRFTAEQSVKLAEEFIRHQIRPEDDLRLIDRDIEEMGASR